MYLNRRAFSATDELFKFMKLDIQLLKTSLHLLLFKLLNAHKANMVSYYETHI